jgi:epothilone polyketide synthase D
VISGERDSMRAVLAEVGRAGWNGRELGDVAFHSPVMEPALPAWRDEVARMRFGAPQCEWVSTVTGRDVAAEMDDPEYWVTHVRQPVRYMAGAQRVWEMGARVWIEIGPTAGLTTLAAEGAGDASSDGVWVAGMRPGRPERDTVRRQIAQAYVAGVRVDWRGWDPVRRARVALPTYPFERTRYWIDAPVRAESAPAVAEWPDAYACEVRWEACEPAPGPARVPTQGGAAWVVCGGRPETVAGASAWLTAHGVAVLPAIVPGSDVAGVVHVGGLDCPAFDGADAARLQESAVVAGCLSVAAVLRAGAASATGARLWVATRGAVAVSGSDREVAPAQAPFWGFGKVAALEYPDAWGGLIDLDPEVDGFAGLERVLIEVGEDQLAVRDGRFLAPRLRQTRLGRRSVSLGADATFLITGGLGALGLEVAERLVASGARHLVLVGRRPPGKAAGARLERFRARGVTLYAERADVTSSHDMRRVFAHMAADMPPLRGVVHAAGANGHHPIADLDAHAMGNVVAAKMSGAWVLHALTRDLPLDFFVCFSSIASVWGSKGQAHYAAANAFLDALVSYRIRRNLPASAINWGPWAAGGMATEEAQSWLGRVGVQPLAPAVALDAFEACLASSGHTVIANVDWPRFLEVYQSRRVSPFFSDMTADMSARAPMPEDTGLADTIRAKGPVEGRRALQHFVREHVVQVLNLDPEHAPAPHQGFFSIGFDSLMALELKDRLAGALHVPLPSTLAFDYANSRDLVEYLAREVLRLDAAETVPDARAVELAGLAGADLPADVRASVDATLKRFDKLMGGR